MGNSKQLLEKAEYCKSPDHSMGEMYDTDGYFFTKQEMQTFIDTLYREENERLKKRAGIRLPTVDRIVWKAVFD